MKQLRESQEKIEDTIAYLEKYLDEMQACVIQETGISNQAQAKIQRNSILRDYAKKMCDAFEQEY